MFSVSEKVIEYHIAILVFALEYSHVSVWSETFKFENKTGEVF